MCCGRGGTPPTSRVVGSVAGPVIQTPQFFVEVQGRRLNKSWTSLIAASEEAKRLGGSVVPA